MAAREAKLESIRSNIIQAARVYSSSLSGKIFMYVFGNEYFEVLFATDRFVHLTGVATQLGAQDFYDKAKDGILTTRQFYFSERHTYGNAKKKLPCLISLPDITNSLVCVVKDLSTMTLTYKLGVTNLSFTLGLTPNVDLNGNKINDWYLPRTLRVKDKAIENSAFSEFVDFIFVRDASASSYSTLAFSSKDRSIPPSLRGLVDDSFFG